MENYFRGTKKHPYHLSIGAVILNDENKVCCHYFEKLTLRNEVLTDFYILMRESMEIGESIEDTLHRGLMEEFGITGDIVTYLGSIQGRYPIGEVSIEKTTLYFLVKMKTFKPELRSQEDVEKESGIQWQSINFLIPKMIDQGNRLAGTLDESSILEKVRQYIPA